MFKLLSAISLSAIILFGMPARAVPITYIFAGVAAGTLGGTSFSGILTLTATGDTTDVTLSGSTYRNDNVATVIDIPGLGSVSVTGPDYMFDNQGATKIGYGVTGIPNCCDIIQQVDPIFATYDLTTAQSLLPFGPDLSVGDWVDVPTSGGLLTLTRFDFNTFEAVLGAVPVPETGGLAIFSCGLLGLVFSRRWNRTANLS